MTRSWEPQSDGTGDRALTKSIVTERPKPFFGACEFCAAPCAGRACNEHRDLLALEDEATRPERAA